MSLTSQDQSKHQKLGDFELLREVGKGGMGAVFRARQISLDRIVAIKILPKRLAANKEFVDRFMREARATAKLNHPNIVTGIDVGCSDGYYYFAMEFVEGETLRARIKKNEKLEENEVLRIGVAVASALKHAHAANIVHRDVKPDNILLDRDNTPKVADLGLARAADQEDDAELTQVGSAVGTPHYMAPEQARGEADIDGRADIYALGCTLYHAATGKTPFESTKAHATLLLKHLKDKIPHPQSINPELSDELCTILSHMVAREKDDRATLQQLIDGMTALLNGRSLKLSPLPAAKLNFLAPAGKTTVKREKIQARESDGEEVGEGEEEQRTGSRPAIRPRKARRANDHSMAMLGVGGAVVLGVLALLMVGGGGGRAPAKKAEKPPSTAEVAYEAPAQPELPAQPKQKKTQTDADAEIAKIRGLDLKPTVTESPAEAAPARPVVVPRPTAKQYMTAAMQDLSAGRRTGEAHENLVNALLQDERHPLALYEMARQLELDGDAPGAGDFYRRAAVELARREDEDSQYSTLRTAALEKLQASNRYGRELTALLEEHAGAITKIAAVHHDWATAAAAQQSADLLKLDDLLPPDKRPKIEKVERVEVAVVKETMAKPDPGPAKIEAVKPPEPVKPPVETVTPQPASGVPLDVERALKAAGWTRVSGNWRKVGGEVYEVTDGKLEADKLSGMTQVFVHNNGSTGSMKFVVRNCHFRNDYGTPMGAGGGGGGGDRYCTGYGVTVKDYEFKIYAPYTSSNKAEDYYPWMDHKVQGVGQRTLVRINCEEGNKSARLEILINEKREKLNNYAIEKQGPFLLEVTGTMTIESPKAAGR